MMGLKFNSVNKKALEGGIQAATTDELLDSLAKLYIPNGARFRYVSSANLMTYIKIWKWGIESQGNK